MQDDEPAQEGLEEGVEEEEVPEEPPAASEATVSPATSEAAAPDRAIRVNVGASRGRGITSRPLILAPRPFQPLGLIVRRLGLGLGSLRRFRPLPAGSCQGAAHHTKADE